MMNKTQTLPTLALTTMITHHEIDDTMSLITVLDRHHDNLQYLVLPQYIARDGHKTRSYQREVFKATKTNSQDEAPSVSTVSAFSSYLGIIMSPPVEDQHW